MTHPAPQDNDQTGTSPAVPSVPATAAVPASPATKDTAAKDTKKKDAKKKAKASAEKTKVTKSMAGSTWAALIIGALLLILLLVFIMQNQQLIELNLFFWTFEFPAGIGYLFSAITGALIMALVGGMRMLELRRQVKKKK
ncbi:DUF1049 domain-containing protein [Corynebacterium alimapuense]|uniref:DUF1049 domain-containing protein n=2 Tax=Corynebacterium alimapuense TaxID=1576874 RepID=A0A3M8K9E0_9CORY|nr:lipopolysaccharide assembly protein LapA domain-containing protein [Corynebacterium alimapuense]RNE49405.1 DUF1049 domain-containing protein [Corynebacterium alimapuense]